MAKKYYVTTPLYYVNSPLTVGGAYTTIVADVTARYQRLRGREVFFLTGSDEHGQKIQQAARAEGISPRQLADRVVGSFVELWDLLEISHDDFIRTTEPRHETVVKEAFRRLVESGDIYPGKYEDWYCTPCETFILQSQLAEGACPECRRPVQRLSEENYFFRLSRYRKELVRLFEADPDFVQPPSRRREMLSRLENELCDISVSRAAGWGIPVPGRADQMIWVWFDALLNYVSAPGCFSPGPRFSQIWPADLHLMAKDIVWFHSILWPAMLLALGLPPPRRIFAHGWWTMKGEKISKSKGEKIMAQDVVERYGADPLRYFMLREIPLGQDGDFSIESLERRYRSDLANEFGNLLQRTLAMIVKYRDGRIPGRGADPRGQRILSELAEFGNEYHELMENLRFSRVLEGIWTRLRDANRYIEESKPWSLHREGAADRLDGVLRALAGMLAGVSAMLQPFLPSTSLRAGRQLEPVGGRLPDIFSGKRVSTADLIVGDGTVARPEPLFPVELLDRVE